MIAQNISSNIVVVTLVSRTYDEVMDYVTRELEIRLVYGHQGTEFSAVLLNL